jgi:hypothetical protein
MLRVDLDEIDEKLMRPIGFHSGTIRPRSPANAIVRTSRIGQPRLKGLRSRPVSRTPLSASPDDRHCGAGAVTAMGLTG